MKTLLILLVSSLACSAQTATNLLTFTNVNGRLITNATLIRVDKDGVLYRFSGGGGRVKFSELAEDDRKRFEAEQVLKNIDASLDARLGFPVERDIEKFTGRIRDRVYIGTASDETELYIAPTRWIKDGKVEYFLITQSFAKKPIRTTEMIILADGQRIVLPAHYVSLNLTNNEVEEQWSYDLTYADVQKIGAAKKLEMRLVGRERSDDFQFDDISKFKTFADFCRTNKVIAAQSNKPPTFAAPSRTYFEIVSPVTIKITEKNNQWCRWSYQVTVRNNTKDPITERITIQFQDASGFVLDDTTEKVSLRPNETKVVSGYDLISQPNGPRVVKAVATWDR